MAQYSVTVNATSNTSVSTEDTFIELFPPSAVSILLKRVRVALTTPALDTQVSLRVTRASAAGATGTAGTIVERRPNGPASVTTVNVKNGTSAFTVGTVVDTLFKTSFNGRGLFEWVARDERDIIESGANQRLNIIVQSGTASTVMNVDCDWEE
jgi:hypothetical protein